MDNLEDVNGYLLLAAQECDKLYDDSDDLNQDIAELEAMIHNALDKLEQIK